MKFIFSLLALVLMIGSVSAIEAPQNEDKMVAIVLMMDDGDDQEIVGTIYASLMTAEKVAKVLDIEMIADDQVTDDVFVFSLKSEDQKKLTMQMFDEEGYSLAASRVLQVEDGNNYNALNVKTLSDGTYEFKLIDENGAEKSQTITINRQQ